MNKLFLLTTVLSTMSTQLIAASGTRGGGHIVQIKQERYLMDMASAAVCDWKRGEELFNDYPELNTIFDELNKIEWYFASELKQELKGLDFCFTGSLRSVSPYDWYSPVGHNRDETIIQGGYRIDNDVYFDKKQLTKISKYDQAMFMIHETMHSFLPMDILERNLKLRTITRVIGRIGKGKSVNTKDLYFNMYKSEVSFPRMLNKLKDYKKQLIFLNASKEESMEMVLNSNNPESLIDFNYLDFNAISEKDYNELYFHMDNVKLRDVLTSLIINGNPSVIKKIIDEKYIIGDLEQREIDIIKNQHEKKDWGWKCNDVPMCNHCDKELCKTRTYGIGNQPMFPGLSDLQEIQLEEPYYYLNVILYRQQNSKCL